MRACAAASAVVVASLLAITACGGGDYRVVVPDVAGLPIEEAFERVCANNLELARPDFSARGPSSDWTPRQGGTDPAVVALSTVPAAGTKVEHGVAITVAIRSPQNVSVVLRDPIVCD